MNDLQPGILVLIPPLARHLFFSLRPAADIPDALFRFTRPVSGAYFWCTPMKGSRTDLSALDL